jgi:hypothetical protein
MAVRSWRLFLLQVLQCITLAANRRSLRCETDESVYEIGRNDIAVTIQRGLSYKTILVAIK